MLCKMIDRGVENCNTCCPTLWMQTGLVLVEMSKQDGFRNFAVQTLRTRVHLDPCNIF